MKLTIIREDGAVYIDGLSYSNLDLSFIPADVHALQFNDASNAGWVEFSQNDFGEKESNQKINVLPEWATIAVNKWEEAKTAEELLTIEAALAQKQAATEQTTVQPTETAA
jgi:hypothetical protein